MIRTHLAARARGDDGAVLVMVALIIVVILLCAGLAVDLGSWYNRAEELQDAADAAALAGASERATGTQADAIAVVEEILRQNGFEPNEDGHVFDVVFVGAASISVEVTDDKVPMFFAGMVRSGFSLSRSATAERDVCGGSCQRELLIPDPIPELDAVGIGDGFAPILVGDRIFAINHHADIAAGADIVCVDRILGGACVGYPMKVSPFQPVGTDWLVPTVVQGSRIWYHGQRVDDLVLGCFDTATDSPCPGGLIPLASLAADTTDSDTQARGGGLIELGGRLWVFSSDQVFCVDPGTHAMCAGYPAAHGLADTGQTPGAMSGAQQTTVAIGERIYVSHTWALEEVDRGAQLHCWSTLNLAPCAGFGVITMHPTGDPEETGRLFLNRSAGGDPIGVCSLQAATVVCVDPDGGPDAVPFGLDTVWSSVGPTRIGLPFWHERSNRLMIPSRTTNYVACYDFVAQDGCGSLSQGLTGDYGYAAEGDCIIGLGHANEFVTFEPDLDVGCNSVIALGRVYTCVCADASRHWGSVFITGDLDSTFGPFAALDLRVFADDGTEYIDMSVLDTTGVISLEGIPTTHDSLSVELTVTGTDFDQPWDTGEVPQVRIGWLDKPRLTE